MIEAGSKVVCIVDFKQFGVYKECLSLGHIPNLPIKDTVVYTVRKIVYEWETGRRGILLNEVTNTHIPIADCPGEELGFWIGGFRELLTIKEVDSLLEKILDDDMLALRLTLIEQGLMD